MLEEEGVSPQIVTGTSMGALVGGLYAIGYSPRTLDRVATHLDWSAHFSNTTDRAFFGLGRRLHGDRILLAVPLTHGRPALPAGLLDAQRIDDLLESLTWRAQTARNVRTFDPSRAGADVRVGRAAWACRSRARSSAPARAWSSPRARPSA